MVLKLGGGGDTQGFSVAQIFSTIGAQGEPGEPSIDGQIGGAPVWYTYVAPTNGDLLINTTGSDFNTMLGVFVGSSGSFATLMNVGAGYTTNRFINGQPQIYVPNVPKGQTNFIVVDGYKGASGRAQLNINLGDSVVITAPPQSQFVVAGSNVMFSVAASGSTPFSYLWQFNGTNLASATASSLTVSDVQADNIGQYSVVVSNLVSAASSSATLSLGTTPAITAQPLSQTVAAGSTVNLSVTASGTPSPDYQWIFNGSNIGTDGSALSIPNFQAGNQGSYTVVVSNSVGAVTSSAALVFEHVASGDADFQRQRRSTAIDWRGRRQLCSPDFFQPADLDSVDHQQCHQWISAFYGSGRGGIQPPFLPWSHQLTRE